MKDILLTSKELVDFDKLKEMLHINQIEEILSIATIVILGIAVVLFFLAIFFLTKVDTNKFQEKTMERLHKSKNGHFNAIEIQRRLNAYGANFIFKGGMSPITYIFVKFCLAIGLFLLGTLIGNILIGLVAGIVGFFALDILLKISNNVDNEKMMDDIKLFCSILNIQTLSGTSISSALAEGYSVVKHPRLKMALTELSSKIFAHQNFNTAVDEFNAQFDNKYIKSCCTILKQSQDSGKSSNLLKSLSNQIVDIQTAIHVKETAMNETKNAFVNILIFAGFMMIVLMALFSEMDLSAIF